MARSHATYFSAPAFFESHPALEDPALAGWLVKLWSACATFQTDGEITAVVTRACGMPSEVMAKLESAGFVANGRIDGFPDFNLTKSQRCAQSEANRNNALSRWTKKAGCESQCEPHMRTAMPNTIQGDTKRSERRKKKHEESPSETPARKLAGRKEAPKDYSSDPKVLSALEAWNEMAAPSQGRIPAASAADLLAAGWAVISKILLARKAHPDLVDWRQTGEMYAAGFEGYRTDIGLGLVSRNGWLAGAISKAKDWEGRMRPDLSRNGTGPGTASGGTREEEQEAFRKLISTGVIRT